jgi:membrane protein DedA with SNARE-associated domain
MAITEYLAEFFTGVISAGGYPAVAFLMALESMIAPVPSEAVMPFAGFLIFEQKFTWLGVIFFSTLGSIIGSLISYYMGSWGGKPFVKRFGKYLLLDLHHLEMTEKFFSKYGQKTIFISRFIPVVRHLISIPAGVGKMPIIKFSFYTIIGAGFWNAFLTWVGFRLRENWMEVKHYSIYADIVIVLMIIAGLVYLVKKQRQRIKNRSPQTNGRREQ